MAIFTKTIKPEPQEPQLKIHLKTPNIVKRVRAKIRPVAKILVVIGWIQLFSGIYGGYHVYTHGKGAHYHHYIHCQHEIKIGASTEYIMDFGLGLILIFGMLLFKRPYSCVQLYVYLSCLTLAMSGITLACAYQHKMASDLLFSGVIWVILHFVALCFGSVYCNLVYEENMILRLVPLICRQKFLVKQVEMQKLNSIPEETV